MTKTSVAVLDIGSSKISVLIAISGENGTFKILGGGEAEYSGFLNGEFLEPKELKYAMGLALSNAAKQACVEIKKLYVGIPAEFSFVLRKNAVLDLGKRRKVKQEDKDELINKAINSFNDENYLLLKYMPLEFKIDHEFEVNDIINQKASNISCELSLIYANIDTINLLNKCFQDLEVQLVEYLSAPYIETEFLLENKNALLIDCGYLTTSITGIKNRALTLLNSFSVGGGHITADLYDYFKCGFAEAESLKRIVDVYKKPKMTEKYNVHNASFVSQDVNMVTLYRINQIAKTVKKCIESCNEKYEKVYLTGGGLCYMKGIKEYLTDMLELQVEIISPPIPMLNKPHLSSIISLVDNIIQNSQVKPKSFLAKIKK